VRRPSCTALLALLIPGLLLVPVLTPASAAPAAVPVAPAVAELPLTGVDPAAADERTALPAVKVGGTARRTVLLTTRRPTSRFGLLGVTWDRAAGLGPVEAWARTRSGGAWSDWRLLGGAADEEPEVGEAAGSRAGTSPLWVGHADGVQVRVDVLSGTAPKGVRVSLVDPGTSPADATAADPGAQPQSVAHAGAAAPPVRTRAAWGADESIRGATPAYAPAVRAVVVHHTASSNDYGPADVPALLRGFYAYHVKSRGWSDVGYNVLVDRFGTAWEGRAGGVSRAVIGAHAGGFNSGTVGVSMIGTYDTVAPSPAMLETVARIVAWKTSSAGVDPQGSVRLTSAGSTRFEAGTVVSLPTVLGHRQVSTTSCPGALGFAALPSLRDRAAALGRGAAPVAGALQLVVPSAVAGGRTAELLVRGGTPGATVDVWFAKRGEQAALRRRGGVLSARGDYRTTFTVDDDWTVFASSGDRATPRAVVRRTPALTADPGSVRPSVQVSGSLTALAGTPVTVIATGTPGAAVSLWLRREGDPHFARRAQGRFDAAGRFSTRYTADRPYTYFARTASAVSAEGGTGLGPVPNELDLAAPATVVAGRTVTLAVQGRPRAPVAVWFSREGERSFTRRREGVLGADGMYRTSFVAGVDHVFFATSGDRSSARRTTRTTGAPAAPVKAAPALRLSAPATVPAGAPVPVTVTGRARAAVELWTRARGAAVWSRLRTGAFGPDGRWATTYPGRDDVEVWAASGGTTSVEVTTLAVPAFVKAPSAPLGSRVVLSGRARPGDAVLVESRRRRTGAVLRQTVRAAADGAFRAAFAVDDEYEHRASTGTRVGAPLRTTVTPTATGAAAAQRGTSLALSGTARPGAAVQVLLRQEDGPRSVVAGRTARELPIFRVGRTVTADATGRWRTAVPVSGRLSWFARADGLASPVRAIAAS
jgi:hypothetical protein